MSSSEENTSENQDSSSESPNEESTSPSPEENNSENQDSSSGDDSAAEITPEMGMIKEIQEITSHTRMVRIGSVVLVLLILSVFILSMISHIRGEIPRTSEETQEFFTTLHKQANAELIPKARKLLKETLDNSHASISYELGRLWTNNQAELLSLATEELDTLVTGVPSNAIKSYNEAITKALADKMDTQLPDGGSERLESGRLTKILQQGLIDSSTERTGDIVAVMFQPHVEELSMMSNHLNAIYDAEYGAMQGRKKQFTLSMALTLMERVNIQLREAESSLKAQQEAEELKHKEKTNVPSNKK
jgi:hypothetical protein